MTDTYKAYRFRRSRQASGCDGSVRILDELLERRPNNAWYRLMKAQCLIVGKKRQEALWIISDMKRDRRQAERSLGISFVSLHPDRAGKVLCRPPDKRDRDYLSRAPGGCQTLLVFIFFARRIYGKSGAETQSHFTMDRSR